VKGKIDENVRIRIGRRKHRRMGKLRDNIKDVGRQNLCGNDRKI